MVRVAVPKDKSVAVVACPQDSVACSDNRELGGSTLCVKDAADCPITDMVIYLKDSPEEALYRSNADYSVSCTV